MSKDHENALPEAVRMQVAQADAIIAQMNQEQGGTPPIDPPADPPADPAPAPADPPADPPKPADPPADPPKQDGERTDWKQKYSVLKGKYDAEVPRLHEDLREARGSLRGLQDQLTQLQTTVAALKEVNRTPPEPAKPLVSEEEVERFGPDLIDVVERVARQAVAPYVDQKIGEVQKSVKRVDETVASTTKSVADSARERLYERLDKAVPNWSEINTDPEFTKKWLVEADPYTGQPRGAMLRAAFERNDTERVIAFFKGFQKEHAVGNSDPSPATPAADPVTPAKPQEPQQKLDELVAPGTPKTGSTGTREESGKGRIWTQAEITSFYEQKNELIKKDPNAELPDEIKAQERDLFKAQAEGRIRN